MNFETLIRYKTLDQVYSFGNTMLLDHALAQSGAAQEAGLKKIQFDACKEQFEDLESVTSILGMSKREFLESAVNEALGKAHEIIEKEGLMERMENFSKC